MRTYDPKVFKEIFAGYASQFEFTEHRVEPVPPEPEIDGVRRLLEPHERFFLSDPEFRLNEKYQGGLTGNYLAALMLFGRGALVAEEFGDWSDGPHKSITSGLSEGAEHAVREAYAAYREAERIVGACPLKQQTEVDRLRKEHRSAKDAAKAKYGVGKEPFYVVKAEPSMSAVDIAAATAARAHNARLDEDIKNVREATADISARLDAANDSARAGYDAWLTAMIRKLLQPSSAVVTNDPAKRRRTWLDVSETYLEQKYKELQCPAVKEFCRALKNNAGVEAGSPFDKGTGQNHGSLFARDVGVKVTDKMIETFVTGLRKKM